MYISEDASDYNSKKEENKHKTQITDLQAHFLKSIVLILTFNEPSGKFLLDFSTQELVSSDSFFSCLKCTSFKCKSCLGALHPAFQVSRLPNPQNAGQDHPQCLAL